MTTLLIEMPAGVAGDMLLGALHDLGGDLGRVEKDLLALGLGPIRIRATREEKDSLAAVRIEVEADQEPRWDAGHDGVRGPMAPCGKESVREYPVKIATAGRHRISRTSQTAEKPSESHPPHRPYRVIRELIDRANLPERVKTRAQRVFRLLAEAEGQVHGVAPEAVEFHEVGAIDAIADVVGTCLMLEQLGVDRVIAGPLLPGSGTVRCAHGRMPVPVPAVAALLARTGAPYRPSAEDTGELTTPTGCALVIGLADAYLGRDAVGLVTCQRLGHGAGHRAIPGFVNVLRLSLIKESPSDQDIVAELRCQMDDATGESLAVLVDELLAAGAKDAYLTPVIMKKGRPGHLLTVLCTPADRGRLGDLILAHSSTIGLRETTVHRRLLPRRETTVEVGGQTIALKVVTLPDGGERAKPEADSVLAAARALNLGFDAVQRAALAEWEKKLKK